MKGGTTYYYWEVFPAIATSVVSRFESYGACQKSQVDYIDVQVKGLLEMPHSGDYVLDNTFEGMNDHPDNHYGAQKLIDTLSSVAKQYNSEFPTSERLHFEDMSLPWGGVFDIGLNWKAPHIGHTIGADADISRKLVPLENRAKLLEIMCAHTPGVFLEQEEASMSLHYHLRVYGRISDGNDGFSESAATTLPCCSGDSVNPENMEACVSRETLFSH